MTGEQKQSLFAAALARLFDETEFYTRPQWARFLGVPAGSLQEWTQDLAAPRGDLLRMIIDILQSRGGTVAIEALSRFATIAERPATEISPLGELMLPTVSEYIHNYILLDSGKRLRCLSPGQQVKALKDGSYML